MAAGRESLSASRVRVVPRRPFWAVPFNEKEFFYRARVLRRAQKQAAAASWTGRCPVLVSSEEVAALANRCQQLEWAAAVAHYNVTQLHERVSLLEAAGEMPPLPLPVVSPEAEPVEHTVQVMSAPASPESADDARREETVEPEAARLVDPLEAEEAAPPDESAAQPAILQDMQPAEQVAELTEATTDAQSSLSRTKKQRRRRRAAADAGATADAEPAADAGALEAEDAAQASIGEDLIVPEPLVAEELQHRGTTGAWAVVQGLQNEKYSQYNGRIVRVGNQRTNGRFETVRPGSKDKLAVRPENLRWLLGSYDGRNAGDDLADEDDGYGELVLLGFDTVKEQWACKHLLTREGGPARYRYRWARIKPSEVSLN